MTDSGSTSSPATSVPESPWTSSWVKWALVLLLIASALARIPGLFYGFPEIVMRDERSYAGVALRMLQQGTLDPGDYRHGGSLTYYLYLSAFSAVYYPGHWLGFYSSVQTAPEWHFYLVARILSLVCSLAGLFLLFQLGRKLFGARIGLWAAALLAVHPTFFRYGQLAKLDTYVVLFSLLAALLFLRVYEQGGRKWFCLSGALIGISVGFKYVMFSLLLCLLGVFFLTRRRVSSGGLPARQASGRLLIEALAIALLLSLAFNFFVVLKPQEVLGQIQRQYLITVEGQHLMASTLPGLGPWMVLTRHIPEMMGWPLAVLALAGWCAWCPKNWQRWLIVTLHPAVHYALVCRSAFGFPRELLPLYPPLCLGSAFAVDWLDRWSRRVEGRPIRLAPMLLAGVCMVSLVAPVRQTYERQRLFLRGNTKVLAKRWVEAHVPRTAKIAREVFVLPMHNSHPREVLSYVLGYHPYEYYRQQGVQYLIKSRLPAGVLEKHPELAANDREIERRGELLASWDSKALDLIGPDLAVYRVVENTTRSASRTGQKILDSSAGRW